jgi:hypothetical protein
VQHRSRARLAALRELRDIAVRDVLSKACNLLPSGAPP